MKNLSPLLLLVLAGCSNASMTSPSHDQPVPATQAAPVTVAVLSRATGQTAAISILDTDPQPPSCGWRDLVVARHLALGGAKNDIVTLANLHQVFIQDVGSAPGYVLFDYPVKWCL